MGHLRPRSNMEPAGSLLIQFAVALARTSQPLPPCQQQEAKEEHEARKVDRAGEGGGRVRIGQRHPIKWFPASDERE